MSHNAVGVQSSMLTIPNINVGDIGQYVCVASNTAGVAESKPITPILIGENGHSLLYYGTYNYITHKTKPNMSL